MAGLIIRPRARILHGHDWVYHTEVLKVFGDPEDGEVISLKDGRDRMLGSAIYHSKSQIVARRFSRQRQELNENFFLRRIQRAQQLRAEAGLDLRVARLLWSESDGVPGVIFDRYGDVGVLQTLTLGMDQRRHIIAAALMQELAPLGLTTIIERNDSSGRILEGLEERVGLLVGEDPGRFPITIAGIRFLLDPLRGQKTGFYLDQANSYRSVAAYAQGKRVLDCFSNQGAFALSAAQAGACHVIAVESGIENIKRIKEHAQLNQLEIQAIGANVFDFLSGAIRQKQEYDLIILDPPSFTKNRKGIKEAIKGYQELHFKAAQLLAPRGKLATFSCSHHVTREEFRQSIADGFYQAKRSAREIATFCQSPDHPILLHLPETEYLKGVVIERSSSF